VVQTLEIEVKKNIFMKSCQKIC